MCGSRNYPYYPHGRSLEIPRGRGVQNKKPSVGGVWIFSGTPQYMKCWRPLNNT